MKTLNFTVLAAALCLPLSADTIFVDAAASAGGDGTTWGTAFNDLQSALTAADGTAGDDEIWVAQGTYKPDAAIDRTATFLLRNGVSIYGGFTNGDAALGDRDSDPATNGTVLSGDLSGNDSPGFLNRNDNSYHVVTGSGTDATAVLDGFTISGGNANGGGNNGVGGAYFSSTSGSPSVSNCLFTDNTATNAGGAVSLKGVATQEANTAPVFTGCLFTGNGVNPQYGGAVEIASSTPQFIGCQFEGNSSLSGGGAIYNYASPTRIIGCSFRGNQADFFGFDKSPGGAIYINQGSPRIANTEFSGNAGNAGGAVYCYAGATPVFTNVTFTGNLATIGGGALHSTNNAAPLYQNCIIWNNRTGAGTATLAASVVNFAPSTSSFSHCIVANSGGSGSWNTAAGADLGGNLDADPLFTTPLDPATAPSAAGDFTIGSGSAAANQGINAADLDGSGSGTETIADLPTDLGGSDRIFSEVIDLGAYESGAVAVTFTTVFPALDPADDDNGNGLSNYLDYALGMDPTQPDDFSARPAINGNLVTFSHRTGVDDATPLYRKSSDLQGWTTMIPGTDYSIQSTTTIGDREEVTLQLLLAPPSDPAMFFIQEFPN